MLIRDMESANLAIGPRTYHGLVFSHLEVWPTPPASSFTPVYDAY